MNIDWIILYVCICVGGVYIIYLNDYTKSLRQSIDLYTFVVFQIILHVYIDRRGYLKRDCYI